MTKKTSYMIETEIEMKQDQMELQSGAKDMNEFY